MIKTGKIWHSPLNVYWHIQKLTEKVGAEAIENRSDYQGVREARIGAVMALVMFQRMGKPTYIQLYKPDPPDVILMQPSKDFKGQLDIILVEMTSFVRGRKESLLEQLKRTKAKPGIHTLSEEYILAVNVGVGLDVDYKPIRDYLNENKTPFPVWAVQQVASYPDTIAKVVMINPELREMNVNVGESAYLLRESKWPDVLHTRRVAKRELVRLERAEKFYQAPWETINR